MVKHGVGFSGLIRLYVTPCDGSKRFFGGEVGMKAVKFNARIDKSRVTIFIVLFIVDRGEWGKITLFHGKWNQVVVAITPFLIPILACHEKKKKEKYTSKNWDSIFVFRRGDFYF
jgi:hypothetical protein